MTANLTPAQARAVILEGKVIRLAVGTHEDDPVLLVYREEGTIYSESIGGWSAGVVEPVCAADSDFLGRYMSTRDQLTVTDQIPWGRTL